MVHIEVVGPVLENGWWKELTKLYLKENLGQEFTIHCWKDEEAVAELALCHGKIKPVDWAYGVAVTGTVTEAFAAFLLEQSQFQEEGPDSGAMMTPFFGVFLGSSFSSSHYGREIDIEPIPGARGAELRALLENLAQRDWLTVYDCDGLVYPQQT